MTSQQFSTLLHDPGLVNEQNRQLLEDIVMLYPYCQSGQMLLACNFHTAENPKYPVQLKKAAAYAGDRRILKDLIGRSKKIQELPSGNPRSDNPPATIIISETQSEILPPEPEIRVVENLTHAFERMTPEELLAIVKKRLAEIAAANTGITEPETLAPEHESRPPESEPQIQATETRINEPVKTASKASLIDKFIQEEPRISKPKTSFFNPTDSAIRSNFDEEEIVSETLAQLYAEQGNIQKAIHIYQKLSLLNQEKSRYFATQIKKLSS